jgi:galactose mutarotase-like enzyme
MGTIATEQRQYSTLVLTDTVADSQIELVPERGGILTQWRVQGQEILYLDAARFTDPSLSIRGGIPILFPICGNLPDNTYTHQGQAYTLKQHGFARDLPWQILAQSTEPLSVTLGLSSSDHTRSLYPFEFDLAFTYILAGHSLTLQQRVSNRSDQPLPFSLGFHPYFTVRDKSLLNVHIPATELIDQRTKTHHSYGGSFDFTVDEIDAAFPDLSSPVASVQEGDRLRLTLTFSPEFSTLVFWTINGKDFYCLEPWTAGRNAINTGDRLIHLAPGTQLDTQMELKVDFS